MMFRTLIYPELVLVYLTVTISHIKEASIIAAFSLLCPADMQGSIISAVSMPLGEYDTVVNCCSLVSFSIWEIRSPLPL